ncbi:HyaD/HybD family hydrogenase maturation endopeptidase [Desulfococcus sp.]|uniref:HyaD/HybD family hydrogenase maturation endopeptidase n=1 Tax=Desulfococcus sp. TaxID=2025834 RepID=UPI0035933307
MKIATALPNIVILGIGNILLTDEGFGIRVIQALEMDYDFSENVSVVDGGVRGIHLLGLISEADHLVVVDAVCGNSKPGTLHRIEGEEIPERIRRKNSLHQLDFLEAMTYCHHGLDRMPGTVILGVEPQSIAAYRDELTPLIQARVMEMVQRVLDEVLRLGGHYRPKRGVGCAAP